MFSPPLLSVSATRLVIQLPVNDCVRDRDEAGEGGEGVETGDGGEDGCGGGVRIDALYCGEEARSKGARTRAAGGDDSGTEGGAPVAESPSGPASSADAVKSRRFPNASARKPSLELINTYLHVPMILVFASNSSGDSNRARASHLPRNCTFDRRARATHPMMSAAIFFLEFPGPDLRPFEPL